MNLLFLGDLRNCYNYGAIATSEALIKMLYDRFPGLKVRYIDFRSLQNATPPEGWEQHTSTSGNTSFYQLFRFRVKKLYYRIRYGIIMIVPYGMVLRLQKNRGKQKESSTISNKSYHIPFLFKDYDDWAKKMMNGSVLQYEKKLFDWADVVLVNGEGNVVNGTDENGVYRHRACYLLFMSWMAKTHFNLPVYIVNHCVDPNNYDAIEMIQKVYPLLDKIVVRDPMSLEKLQSFGIDSAVFAPDALFSYENYDSWQPSVLLKKQIDFSKPYILLGDSSGIQNVYGKVQWNVTIFFKCFIKRLQKIIPQVVFVDGYSESCEDINSVIAETGIGRISLQNCSYQELYKVMSHAEIFISGRWHASILSLLAGTPILLFGADSHKTRSLYSIINYPYKFFETISLPIHIDEMIEEVKKILLNRNSITKEVTNICSKLKKESYYNVECLKDIIE